jgi:hypothetical protein
VPPPADTRDVHAVNEPVGFEPLKTTNAMPPAPNNVVIATVNDQETPMQLATLQTALKPPVPVSIVPESTVARPMPREIDIQARLADEISKLNLPKVSLKDMARLISSMSTVPITFDDSVFSYGLTPDSNVSILAEGISVAELIEKSVAPRKLTTRVEGNHLVIEHVSASRGKIKSISHDVSDLVSDDSGIDRLTELVKNFALPAAWNRPDVKLHTDGKLLNIDQTHAGYLQTALFLDRLRSARGIETRQMFGQDVVSIDARWRAADRLLSNRITLRHKEPMRLDQLLRELEDRSGLHLLVDWLNLDREGWTESTMVTSNKWQEETIDVLQDVVSQLGVTFRVISNDTIVITTHSAEKQLADVGFFPIDDLLENGQRIEDVIELTKQSVGISSFDAAAGGWGTIGFDRPSQMLIVRLPPSDLRVVEQVMSNWRSL